MALFYEPPVPPQGWYEDVLARVTAIDNAVTLGLALAVFLLAVLVVGSWGK